MFGTTVSDMQSADFTVGTAKMTGTLKYLSEGQLVTTWGAGNFMALKFGVPENAVSMKVGLNPSEGGGLVEIIDDPDKNGAFKVTNKATQKFKIVVKDANDHEYVREYDLSELTCLEE